MPRGAEEPDLARYEDYRAYLRDYYAFRKVRNPRFSHGAFVRKAGIASRSHLKDVIEGRRNLTGPFVEKYVQALGLTSRRAACFRLLVALAQAATPGERRRAQEDLQRWRSTESSSAGDAELRSAARGFPFWVVYGMRDMRGFRADPRWISRRCLGRVSVEEARSALEILGRKGFLGAKGRSRLVHIQAQVSSMEKVTMRLQRHAADPAFRSDRYRSFSVAFRVLRPAEISALHEAMTDWQLTRFPPRREGGVDGELTAIVSQIIPLTLPPKR